MTEPQLAVRLVCLPFDSDARPQLALSVLREVLVQANIHCEIDYANLDYVGRIGCDNYTLVGERYSGQLLGDALFSQAVFGHEVNWDRYARLATGESGHDSEARTFAQVASVLAHLSEQWADDYVDSSCWRHIELVGFSATFNILPIVAIAQRLRIRHPHIRTVVGGAQCEGELGAGLIRAFPAIDFVCRGEGERTIQSLVQRLSAGRRTFHDLPGLCWRSVTGEVVINGGRSPEVKFDESPIPRFDDYLSTRRRLLGEVEALRCAIPFETSRGCWFGEKSHCTFCGLNGEAMHHRQRSPNKALEVIMAAAAYGTSTGFAVDNILPYEYFKTVLPALAERKPKFEIFYEVKSNLTIEQCRLLVAAGVRAIQPGIESLSSPVLHLMRKGTSAFLNVRLMKYAAQTGLNLAWNLLYGFPLESPDDYAAQAALVPLLSHLQPPVGDCARVRVDRFSPMYLDAAALGISQLRPASIYNTIYPTEFPYIDTLAVFFDYSGKFQGNPDEYARALKLAVRDWREGSGEYALVGLARADIIDIWDHRMGHQPAEYTLDATQASVLRACEHGQSKQGLCNVLPYCDTDALEAALEQLCRLKLVVELDKRWLSLVLVAKDNELAMTPAALRLPLVVAVHRQAMKRLRQRQADYQLEGKVLTCPIREQGETI